MLKDITKTIGLLTAIFIIGNVVGLLQRFTETLPEYMFFLLLFCMIAFLWVQVIKFVKVNF